MIEIDLYEYVMESAQFEIDNGNSEFSIILEEAEVKVKKENDNWFASLKTKIIAFCKSIISKARMIISKIGNAKRIQQAKFAGKKLDKAYILKGNNIAGKQKDLEELNFLDKKLNSDIGGINEIIEKLAKDPSAAKKNEDFEKVSFGSREGTQDKTAKLGYISYQEMKSYLDKSINYANRLNQSVKNLDSQRNKMKSDGYSASQIRLAVTSAYNAITRYLRNYFSIIMSIFKEFMRKADVNTTSSRNTDELRYDVDDQMKKTADKMNEIFGKNKDDSSKKSSKKSVSVDDIASGKANLDDVMNDPNATISF